MIARISKRNPNQLSHGLREERSFRSSAQLAMQLRCQDFDPLAQLLDQLGQVGVLLHQLEQPGGFVRGHLLPLLARQCQRFAMLGVGVGMRFVAVGLAGLRQKNERRGVGGLQAEGEVQKDKGIDIKMGEPEDVDDNPDGDDERLADEKNRGAEETGECFGLEREPIIPKDGSEVPMRQMKAEMVRTTFRRVGREACVHPSLLMILF